MTHPWPDSRLFWRDKRVCVTGGAGFLGSAVVARLRDRGAAQVVVPRSRQYDLRHVSHVRQLLDEVRPDLIIHLAGRVGGIGANIAHPAAFFYDNLMMGVQLLHEAWTHGVQKFVAAGSACAYPKVAPIPFNEADFWNGYPEETNAPYALAKKMLLVQAQAYREEHGFNAIYVVPSSLYGPQDNFDLSSAHVIPALIRRMLEAIESGARDVTFWGDGSPTREFLYVDDAAEGIVLAAERYDDPVPVNLAGAGEISIRDLATLIGQLLEFRGEILWDTSQPNGQPRRKLDGRRGATLVGFAATTPFEVGLRQTITWYRHHVVQGRRPGRQPRG